VHVTVIPMDTPRELPDSTVLVKGNRIVAVGPSSRTVPTAGARVIDGAGRFLMPGLADMHAHLNDQPAMIALVANGVTTVRDMWGWRKMLLWRSAVQRGEMVGPTIHDAGPALDGPGGDDGATTVKDAEDARRVVDAQHASGYEFIKVLSHVPPVAYDAIIAESARVGMPVAGHVPWAVGLEHVLDSHQRSIEHLFGYVLAAQRDDSPLKDAKDLESRWRSVDYVDANKLSSLVARTREAGAWNCPTLVVQRHFAELENPKAMLAHPELRYVSPRVRAGWNPATVWNGRATPGFFAALRRTWPVLDSLVKQLHDAGARLLLGTDFPNPYVVPGFAVHDELAYLVEAGLTPYEALRTGTADAAEYLGDDFGQVAPGKRADLVLLDADPLLDVRNTAKREGVLLRGVWYSEADLQDLLERAAHTWDDSVDRLAKLPPLSGADGSVTRSYRDADNGVLFGQERYLLDSSAGGLTLTAQAAYDEDAPGARSIQVSERVDAAGVARVVDLRRESMAGVLTAHLTIAADRVTGEAQVDGEEKTRIEAQARAAIPLPGPIGAWEPAMIRAQSLAVKGTTTFDAIDVEAEPAPHVVVIRERLERLPDDHGVRRYAVQETRPNGANRFELRFKPGDGMVGSHQVAEDDQLDVTSVR